MRIILILVIFSTCTWSHAKTIFEPGFSLGAGSGEVKADGLETSSGTGYVGTFGFRYGITRRYMQVTAVVEGTMFTGKNVDTTFAGYGGLGFGYEWNIPLRTYILLGAYNFDKDLVGPGLELAYFVNDSFWLGVRYSHYKTNLKQTVGSTEYTTELNASIIGVTLSFPIEFEYPDHWFRKTDWE